MLTGCASGTGQSLRSAQPWVCCCTQKHPQELALKCLPAFPRLLSLCPGALLSPRAWAGLGDPPVPYDTWWEP